MLNLKIMKMKITVKKKALYDELYSSVISDLKFKRLMVEFIFGILLAISLSTWMFYSSLNIHLLLNYSPIFLLITTFFVLWLSGKTISSITEKNIQKNLIKLLNDEEKIVEARIENIEKDIVLLNKEIVSAENKKKLLAEIKKDLFDHSSLRIVHSQKIFSILILTVILLSACHSEPENKNLSNDDAFSLEVQKKFMAVKVLKVHHDNAVDAFGNPILENQWYVVSNVTKSFFLISWTSRMGSFDFDQRHHVFFPELELNFERTRMAATNIQCLGAAVEVDVLLLGPNKRLVLLNSMELDGRIKVAICYNCSN